MHEEGDHATKNQLSGSLLQGDGLEKRLEQWECILHDQHGRLLLQRLANGPLPHHYFAQIRRKEEAPPPFEPTHVEKAQLQKQFHRLAQGSPRGHTTVPSPGTWARASGSAVGCRQSPRSTCRRDAPPARIPGPTLAPLAGQGWGERADDLGGQARPVLPQG